MITKISTISTSLLLITYYLLLTTYSFGNNPAYAVDKIPAALKENANAVIRAHHHEFKVYSIKEAKEKVKGVITIFNENSSYGYLVVHYNQSKKIGKIKAKIYNKTGGEIRKIEKSEIIDHQAYDGISIYSDARMKYIDFSYGVYPYTIEYEYEIEHSGFRGYPIWQSQQYKTGVETSTFTLSLPEQMTFRYQAQNLATAEPVITTKEGRKAHQWSINQAKAILKEAYCPEGYQILPLLITVPTEFHIDGYTGNMGTWQSFGQFMYNLNKDRGQLSPRMQALVREKTATATTDAEKVAILYQYLKDNMRYVSVQLGIGGWQAFDAKYVEQNKYGDCKALTYFMKAMLDEIDIPSHPALVNAGDQSLIIQEDFATPYFNHIILKVLLDEPIWLECTSNISPTGYLGSFTKERPVLLITEKGGIVDHTPSNTEEAQIGATTIALTATGGATITNQTLFKGTAHESFRRKAVYASKEEQEKWFLKYQNFPSFSIEELTFSASDTTAEAQCGYTIKVPRYASKAGKRLFIPLNKVNPLGMSLSKDSDRVHPVALSQTFKETDQIILQLPEGYTIESLPKPTALESPYGTYTTTLEVVDQTIVFKRNLTLPAQQVPAAEYEQLRAFLKAILKADSAKMVLVEE